MISNQYILTMKNLKVIMLAGALAITASASAQFANTGNASKSGSTTSIGSYKDTNPYNRFSVSYINETIKPDFKDADNQSTSGFGLKYIHGFSLSNTLPLFLETGLDLHVGFWSDTNDYTVGYGNESYGYVPYDAEWKQKLTTMNLAIPVNIAYKFNINEDFSIQPYLGLNFKFNVLGKIKNSIEITDNASNAGELQEKIDDLSDKEFEEHFMKKEVNMFDKDDTGSKDSAWKRFQMGWHIGVGFNYKAFNIGVSYGTDFIALCKKTNTSTFAVGVGFNF